MYNSSTGDYTDEEREFLIAVDKYKRAAKRVFVTYSELLAVAKSLGYRRVAEAGPLPKLVCKHLGRPKGAYSRGEVPKEGHKDKGGAQP